MRSAFSARLAPRGDLRWSPRRGAGTSDALEEVLAPGYFGIAGGLLRSGDLIHVRARPGGAEAAVRMALLMVRAGASGAVSVRLVQDFGRTDDPDPVDLAALAVPVATPAPAAAPKRGRGRPPRSRNRKNGAISASTLN